jgi:hypothetical protein
MPLFRRRNREVVGPEERSPQLGRAAPEFVRESTDFFEALAARHAGEYDGWEAGV